MIHRDLANVIYKFCNVIISSAILQKNQDRERLEEGVEMIKLVMREVLSTSHGWESALLRLESGYLMVAVVYLDLL